MFTTGALVKAIPLSVATVGARPARTVEAGSIPMSTSNAFTMVSWPSAVLKAPRMTGGLFCASLTSVGRRPPRWISRLKVLGVVLISLPMAPPHARLTPSMGIVVGVDFCEKEQNTGILVMLFCGAGMSHTRFGRIEIFVDVAHPAIPDPCSEC